MKLSKHDLKFRTSSKLYYSEKSDRRVFHDTRYNLMACDVEDGWEDAMNEIHKMKQEEVHQAEIEENKLIVELFPWFACVLPVK